MVSSRQVATCEHVIRAARAIMVFAPDGRRFPAAVGAADARNDVAVLNVSGSLPPPLTLGSYSQTREGDEVAVSGYPSASGLHRPPAPLAARSAAGWCR